MTDARLLGGPAPKGVIPAKRSAERESSGAFNRRALGWIPAVAALAGMTNIGDSKDLNALGGGGRRRAGTLTSTARGAGWPG